MSQNIHQDTQRIVSQEDTASSSGVVSATQRLSYDDTLANKLPSLKKSEFFKQKLQQGSQSITTSQDPMPVKTLKKIRKSSHRKYGFNAPHILQDPESIQDLELNQANESSSHSVLRINESQTPLSKKFVNPFDETPDSSSTPSRRARMDFTLSTPIAMNKSMRNQLHEAQFLKSDSSHNVPTASSKSGNSADIFRRLQNKQPPAYEFDDTELGVVLDGDDEEGDYSDDSGLKLNLNPGITHGLDTIDEDRSRDFVDPTQDDAILKEQAAGYNRSNSPRSQRSEAHTFSYIDDELDETSPLLNSYKTTLQNNAEAITRSLQVLQSPTQSQSQALDIKTQDTRTQTQEIKEDVQISGSPEMSRLVTHLSLRPTMASLIDKTIDSQDEEIINDDLPPTFQIENDEIVSSQSSTSDHNPTQRIDEENDTSPVATFSSGFNNPAHENPVSSRSNGKGISGIIIKGTQDEEEISSGEINGDSKRSNGKYIYNNLIEPSSPQLNEASSQEISDFENEPSGNNEMLHGSAAEKNVSSLPAVSSVLESQKDTLKITEDNDDDVTNVRSKRNQVISSYFSQPYLQNKIGMENRNNDQDKSEAEIDDEKSEAEIDDEKSEAEIDDDKSDGGTEHELEASSEHSDDESILEIDENAFLSQVNHKLTQGLHLSTKPHTSFPKRNDHNNDNDDQRRPIVTNVTSNSPEDLSQGSRESSPSNSGGEEPLKDIFNLSPAKDRDIETSKKASIRRDNSKLPKSLGSKNGNMSSIRASTGNIAISRKRKKNTRRSSVALGVNGRNQILTDEVYEHQSPIFEPIVSGLTPNQTPKSTRSVHPLIVVDTTGEELSSSGNKVSETANTTQEEPKRQEHPVSGILRDDERRLKFHDADFKNKRAVFITDGDRHRTPVRIRKVMTDEDNPNTYDVEFITRSKIIDSADKRFVFAPICLRVGTLIKLSDERSGTYIITGLKFDAKASTSITCMRGYNVIYYKKRSKNGGMEGKEKTCLLENIYLTSSFAFKLPFQPFTDQSQFNRYLRELKKDCGVVINKSRPINIFQDCFFVITSLSTTATTATASSSRAVSRNTESDDSKLEKFITKNGGKVVDDDFENLIGSTKKLSGYKFAALLSPTPIRTKKYLQFVALHWPILSVNFINDMIRHEKLRENWREHWKSYVLPSGTSTYWNNTPVSLELFQFETKLRNGSELVDQLRLSNLFTSIGSQLIISDCSTERNNSNSNNNGNYNKSGASINDIEFIFKRSIDGKLNVYKDALNYKNLAKFVKELNSRTKTKNKVVYLYTTMKPLTKVKFAKLLGDGKDRYIGVVTDDDDDDEDDEDDGGSEMDDADCSDVIIISHKSKKRKRRRNVIRSSKGKKRKGTSLDDAFTGVEVRVVDWEWLVQCILANFLFPPKYEFKM